MLPPYPLLLDDHSLAVDEFRLEKGIDERSWIPLRISLPRWRRNIKDVQGGGKNGKEKGVGRTRVGRLLEISTWCRVVVRARLGSARFGDRSVLSVLPHGSASSSSSSRFAGFARFQGRHLAGGGSRSLYTIAREQDGSSGGGGGGCAQGWRRRSGTFGRVRE